ncbi:crotonase/enoyl-CoA hydratase family protein [Parahalioglobus pacificus]|uniref:Enoyl-CoA hydratase n=1 Tax=Parahalioglobus pacificus TaxID=930806 RepID=A0A918XH69_9GAMM|nr:crotonase/enoyl-CoA hydratase family protein [Halioglobus pacificus]GHD30591.1 enoyl-CoA hydratase [Halioglobus pacificus]
MNFETLEYNVEGHILTLRLNRPDRMNAFTTPMAHELVAAIDAADADDDIRAIVTTGNGKAFCAGADLGGGSSTFDYDEKPDNAQDPTAAPRDTGGRVTLRLFQCTKPVIGAINGAAVGIGATMTLPMDIRLASERARFGFVFARRGIVPEAASSWFLPRVVGISQALEWCMRGHVFGADEALAGGLVKAVYPEDQLLPAAYAIANEIAENTAPVSVALTRQLMWRMLGEDHPMAAHKLDSRGVYFRGKQADAQEGVMSFLEKRPANFNDKPSQDMPEFYPWWEEPQYD